MVYQDALTKPLTIQGLSWQRVDFCPIIGHERNAKGNGFSSFGHIACLPMHVLHTWQAEITKVSPLIGELVKYEETLISETPTTQGSSSSSSTTLEQLRRRSRSLQTSTTLWTDILEMRLELPELPSFWKRLLLLLLSHISQPKPGSWQDGC